MNIWKSTSKIKTITTVSKPKYFAGCSPDGFYNGVWAVNSCKIVGGKISRVSATLINGCWDATYDEKGNAVWWPHTSIHGKPPKCKVLFVLNKKQTEKLNDIIGGRHYRDIYEYLEKHLQDKNYYNGFKAKIFCRLQP